MLTEICQYLKNWFNRKPDGTSYPIEEGYFTIENGVINATILKQGQYFRIMGSLFNDGVYKYGIDTLTDETFEGVIWSMGVPKVVEQLASDIEAWQTKYGSAENPAMSPFTSESYAGYSYSKNAGASSGADGNGNGWQSVFAARLNPWRKI